MTGPRRIVVVIFVVGWWIGAAGAAAQGSDPWGHALAALARMEVSDYDAARALVAGLGAAEPEGAAHRFARGVLRLHEGAYEAATEDLTRAAVATNGAAVVEQHRRIAAATAGVVRDFATYRTHDGLFEIRYDASRDEVLIPWAEETLEAAYYEIGYDLGSWPTPPIRVEIYPSARTLAQTSPLTEAAIEGSGTIALCKYDKLMLTSPRATLQGYAWRTTLAHEYVHYAVGHLVHADVPIWMHEALAKYLEGRWTGARAPALDPSGEALLSERIAAGDLITFAQMHPSMAYLPTPEDASTAYAEVFTVMEYLEHRRGSGILRDMLARLRAEGDVVAAISAAIGEPFDVFERNWRAYLVARPRVEAPGRVGTEVQLLPESGDDAAVDRFAGISSTVAQDHLRLGELLRARGHTAAAVIEYEKAAAVIGGDNPTLQSALAQALLDLGRFDAAIAAVDPVVRRYPSTYLGWLRRGAARLGLGEAPAAIADLVIAGGINPFDPEVHTQLAIAYDAFGRADEAARHRRFAGMVTR